LELLLGSARRFATAAKAPNTVRAYESDWEDFHRFCTLRQAESLPAGPWTVSAYLSHMAEERGLKTSTILRRAAAVSQTHKAAGFPSPVLDSLVQAVLAGLRRVKGSAQQGKTALSVDAVRQMADLCGADLRGLRDRAVLLIGFAGGFRRSELTSLNVEDLSWQPEGVVLCIRHSKTDPTGQGQVVAIPWGKSGGSCPVAALQAWLKAAEIYSGPIFRPVDRWKEAALPRRLEDHRVATLLKELAARAGMNTKTISAHSLRSGFATSAAEAGASERAIMEQTRHQSVQQLRRYIQRGSLFRDNAARYLEL
jgi:site-specific recombinase XerD